MFSGFSQKTGDFLWDLSFHNERPWFKEHKDEFETYLHEPFKALARAVYEQLSDRYPDAAWQVHISRIYRDARRLYGRPPYNDHLWFTIWKDGADKNGPAFWFEISPRDYTYGMGYWMTKAEYMESYRKAISANPARFERLAKDVLANSRLVLQGEEYRKAKGDLGEIINPWYNRKYVTLQCLEDFGGDLFSPGLVDRLAEDFCSMMPMYDFFCECFCAVPSGSAE